MAGAAEFSVIDFFHGHLASCLLHAEMLWMAIITGKGRCVELMAEYHIAYSLNLIRKFFVKFLHNMTFCAFGRRECLFAVVALSTECACIYVFHGYACGSGLHDKHLWMAVPAPGLPGMRFVIEFRRHARFLQCNLLDIMAGVA